jgi:hypothetical protein
VGRAAVRAVGGIRPRVRRPGPAARAVAPVGPAGRVRGRVVRPVLHGVGHLGQEVPLHGLLLQRLPVVPGAVLDDGPAGLALRRPLRAVPLRGGRGGHEPADAGRGRVVARAADNPCAAGLHRPAAGERRRAGADVRVAGGDRGPVRLANQPRGVHGRRSVPTAAQGRPRWRDAVSIGARVSCIALHGLLERTAVLRVGRGRHRTPSCSFPRVVLSGRGECTTLGGRAAPDAGRAAAPPSRRARLVGRADRRSAGRAVGPPARGVPAPLAAAARAVPANSEKGNLDRPGGPGGIPPHTDAGVGSVPLPGAAALRAGGLGEP